MNKGRVKRAGNFFTDHGDLEGSTRVKLPVLTLLKKAQDFFLIKKDNLSFCPFSYLPISLSKLPKKK